MTEKSYPGYPQESFEKIPYVTCLIYFMHRFQKYTQYVIVSMMKCGTKSMNKCFKSLGYRGEHKFSLCFSSVTCLNHIYKILVPTYNFIKYLTLSTLSLTVKNLTSMANRKYHLLNSLQYGKKTNMTSLLNQLVFIGMKWRSIGQRQNSFN